MKDRVIILGANRFDFKGTNDRQVRGCKVRYTDGKPVMADASRIGISVGEVSADFGIFMDLEVLPGVYDVEFQTNVTKQGVTLFMQSARLVGPLKLDMGTSDDGSTRNNGRARGRHAEEGVEVGQTTEG